MTQKEFEALLAVEGNTMRVWLYEKNIWIAEVNNENHAYPLEYVIGDDRDSALSLLMTTYYANN